ncbi:hypothetical protein CPC08DRAFT_760254 [Agrocybe pediades]|nr:hypothetical protein CPC08DRAFT_760254 [Agrocybe pediades]
MAFFRPSLLSRRVFDQVVLCKSQGSRQLYSSIALPSAKVAPTLGFNPPVGPTSVLRAIQRNATKHKSGMATFTKGASLAGLGLGLSLAFQKPQTIECDSGVKVSTDPYNKDIYPPPPESSISMYELGFGTVAGVCAGVFVKKGAKALAWFLGGIFVLLQYMRSASLLTVDWGRVSQRFESAFHSKDPVTGKSKPPTVVALWRWLVDFLTADFQPRASFIAGFGLGLRIG